MLSHLTPQGILSDRTNVHDRLHRRCAKWQKHILLVAFVTGLLPNSAMGEAFVPKQAQSVFASPSYLHLVAQKPLGAEELNTIAVFEKAAQAVVYITNTAVRRDIWS
ncbi:MAG TPA: hypothetical protein VLA60_04820, partial [Nitrospirales bacterium]|nr:hypothetical protein [Nitrospirales bacterium]